MDYRLPPELVQWQLRVRRFVEGELQPHDEEIERTGIVPTDLLRRIAAEGPFLAQGWACIAGHKSRLALNGGRVSVSCATLDLEVEIASPLGDILSA